MNSLTSNVSGFTHVQLESRALRVEQQLKKLEKTNWTPQVKETLSEFYHGRLADLTDRINANINEIEVFDITEVKA